MWLILRTSQAHHGSWQALGKKPVKVESTPGPLISSHPPLRPVYDDATVLAYSDVYSLSLFIFTSNFDRVAFLSVIWLEQRHQCLGAVNTTGAMNEPKGPVRPFKASFPSFRWGGKGTDGVKPHVSSLTFFLTPVLSMSRWVYCAGSQQGQVDVSLAFRL